MASTRNIEIDSDVLERLRARRPGRSDRELIENLAMIELGRATVSDVQRRFALPEQEAISLGVRAVHEARRASR